MYNKKWDGDNKLCIYQEICIAIHKKIIIECDYIGHMYSALCFIITKMILLPQSVSMSECLPAQVSDFGHNMFISQILLAIKLLLFFSHYAKCRGSY